MPHWLLKSATHRVISWLPRPQFWNGLLQTAFTRSTVLTRQGFEHKVAECQRHFQAFSSFHSPEPAFSAFELGTGWFPVIPIGLYLCGATEIWTIDIEPLLRRKAVIQVLEYYGQCEEAGVLHKILPSRRTDRVETLRSVLASSRNQPTAALLETLKIHVIVADARRTSLPDGTVDFFVSSGVLEYIPRPVLGGILKEFRRVAAPGAVMIHRLNLVDQFSYFDSSITPFNFLRYTDKEWHWRNSPLIWQNRLRISDYRELLAEAGFELVREENASGEAQELARVKLAAEFMKYSREDLLVLHSFLTSRLKKL